jgi:peptidyl-tRNA hydrolase, PTH1 family
MNNAINLNQEDKMMIIAGLGNPGDKYENTRHNAGFIFLDYLAKQIGEKWEENKKLKCRFIKHGQLILIKPETFMNNSGEAIYLALSYYKLLPKKFYLTEKNADLENTLLIVHDDLDIDFGKYKISYDSRAAGHNGVQSIIDRAKTKKFKRLRIGIKSELLKHAAGKDFVLDRFSKDEKQKLEKLIEVAFRENFFI